ncbi:MAG: hypothetical protein ACE5IC_08520 [Candidatus Brocadiales bacterium]
MGLLDQSHLQINYRNPVYLDGKLFFIKEQQMDVEWLQQEADNWSLSSHTRPLRLANRPDDWVPVKSTVAYSNTSEPSRFTAHYNLTWIEKIALARPKVNLNALYSSSIALGLVPGLFMRELLNATIAALWVGIPEWVEETWSFLWTPGMGDGMARTLPSVEREVQLYVDFLMEHELI